MSDYRSQLETAHTAGGSLSAPVLNPALEISRLRGLQGRIAVVTGAGGDIGSAISYRLALEGVRVIVTDRRVEGVEQCVSSIAAAGGIARPLEVDVTSSDHVDKIVPFAQREFGGSPQILVTSAGVQTFGDVFELTDEEWSSVFDVNVRGLSLTLGGVAPAMGTEGRGSIVTIASIQGRLGNRYYTHYAASKAAVISLTKSYAVAMAPSGVRVNSVAPGIVDTAMWRTADRELARLRGVPPGQPRRERVEQVPLKRPGTPQDVAGAVAFLASDDAAYITGECMHVCGGDVML